MNLRNPESMILYHPDNLKIKGLELRIRLLEETLKECLPWDYLNRQCIQEELAKAYKEYMSIHPATSHQHNSFAHAS